MTVKLVLKGDMIPRSVRRFFDHRLEERVVPETGHALLIFRGHQHLVDLLNISRSGAMIATDCSVNIGEQIVMHIADHDPMPGYVRWVRSGRIGINFRSELSLETGATRCHPTS